MNQFAFMGKVTTPKTGQAIQTGTTKDNKLWVRFTVAVYDSYRKESDFFSVAAFGKTAEICERFLDAGSWVGLTGNIKNDTIDRDGQRYYQQSFIVQNVTLPPKGSALDAAAQRRGTHDDQTAGSGGF